MKNLDFNRPGLGIIVLGLFCWIKCFPSAYAGDVTVEILTPDFSSCGGLEVAAQGSDDSLILLTAVWDWGDGIVESLWIPAFHQYSQNGDYIISLTLTFATGEIASDTYEVNISNAEDEGCVTIGRVQLEPAYLMLSASDSESAQLTIKAWDRNGLELETGELVPQFVMDANPHATIQVDTGLVTAVAPLGAPYAGAVLSGVGSSNAVLARITKTDLGLEYIPMRGQYITYYLPKVISDIELQNLAIQYQLVKATDLSYLAQNFVFGLRPYSGHTQYLVVDADRIEDPAEDTLPCGLAGNPVSIGWAIDPINGTYGGCFIYSDGVSEVQLDTPQWTVIFHEMGHNFSLSSFSFNQFAAPASSVDYVETIATFGAAYSLWSLLECPTDLTESTLATMEAELADWKEAETLIMQAYRSNGTNHEEYRDGEFNGTMFELFDEYGPGVWFDFGSLFFPENQPLPCEINSTEDQFGIFAAVISASVGEDLRNKFRNDYGFPIEDENWSNLLSCAQQRIDARSFSMDAACAVVAPIQPIFKDSFEILQ